MKIAIVHGSPRSGGVSLAMADRLAVRLREGGHRVDDIRLARLKYRGCAACLGCKGKSDRGVIGCKRQAEKGNGRHE